MDKILTMTIENLGARVVSVWKGLRPATRGLVERALASAQTQTDAKTATHRGSAASYDARAEWELSRLLSALDERATEAGAVVALSVEQLRDLRRMAETCAIVLHQEARSAEVFAQLLGRALWMHDYARVDLIADSLPTRLPPSEICELARHPDAAVRAIAHEALLQTPTSVLVDLLNDPIDGEIAREALERQAGEYGSEEARWVISALDRVETSEDDM
ncbi:MAG: hypothetical protein H0W76_22050 [Pyrinomonadaceae bacterium]|nr:hypothetical protein [Pyrinomonadaceae bacterium]